MAAEGVDIVGVVQSPYLSCGSLSGDKNLEAVDVVCDAPLGVNISVGWNQRSLADRTADYLAEGDTLTGTPVPLPLQAPSFDLKLTFPAGQQWEWFASNLHTTR